MEERNDAEMESGYAFVILAGSTVMYMLVSGGAKSYGLLYTEMLNYFQEGSGHTGWVGGIYITMILALGTTSNILAKRYTFRKVTFIGGLIAGAGHVATAYVPSVDYVILTYGIIVGTGFGFVFMPSVTIISYYFVKHRYLANSMSVAWSGIWAIAMSFLFDYLLQTYGFRGSMLIVGGITLHICAAACTFIQPNEFRRSLRRKADENKDTHADDQYAENKEEKHNCVNEDLYLEFKNQFLQFKNPTFAFYVVSFTLLMFAYSNCLILITVSIRELGLGKTDEAINVAIMGGCDTVTRLAFGWFTDKKLIQTRFIYVFNMAMGGLFAFLYPFFKSLTFLRIYSASVGVFIASYMALVPPLLIESFGMKDYPHQIGLMFTCSSFIYMASQPFIGWTEDMTGSWDIAFFITGAVLVVGIILLLLEPILSRLCKSKLQEEEQLPSNIKYVTKL